MGNSREAIQKCARAEKRVQQQQQQQEGDWEGRGTVLRGERTQQVRYASLHPRRPRVQAYRDKCKRTVSGAEFNRYFVNVDNPFVPSLGSLRSDRFQTVVCLIVSFYPIRGELFIGIQCVSRC